MANRLVPCDLGTVLGELGQSPSSRSQRNKLRTFSFLLGWVWYLIETCCSDVLKFNDEFGFLNFLLEFMIVLWSYKQVWSTRKAEYFENVMACTKFSKNNNPIFPRIILRKMIQNNRHSCPFVESLLSPSLDVHLEVMHQLLSSLLYWNIALSTAFNGIFDLAGFSDSPWRNLRGNSITWPLMVLRAAIASLPCCWSRFFLMAS